ncbi:MAG: phosphoribosyltransferase [Crocosphaera sp.]|nr:phosphoribosyltransferase [Crocosphaera sp.]
MKMHFYNRAEAGEKLAEQLTTYKDRGDVLVLALPRGGVPVAFEIAKRLNLPLDVCVVRKLGVPDRPELAMGAIALGGVRIINQDVVNWLQIPPQIIEEVTCQEEEELHRREQVYRGDSRFPKLYNKTIILVDDGIATGSTIRAAIAILEKQQAKKIIIAVPIAPPNVCQALRHEVDQLVCLTSPENLNSISLWYEDFSQTTDEEVCSLLFLSQQSLLIAFSN